MLELGQAVGTYKIIGLSRALKLTMSEQKFCLSKWKHSRKHSKGQGGGCENFAALGQREAEHNTRWRQYDGRTAAVDRGKAAGRVATLRRTMGDWGQPPRVPAGQNRPIAMAMSNDNS